MVTTALEAIGKINELLPRLHKQARDAQQWQRYYEGDQPLAFSSKEWHEWFGDLYEGFSDNWCAPVVDATAERQHLRGFRQYESKRADAELQRVLAVTGADLEFGLAATEAQYARRAFALVWGNPLDPATPEISYESPQQMFVQWAPGSRRTAIAALKTWRDDWDGTRFATLYTPQHVWKFQSAAPAIQVPGVTTALWKPRQGLNEPWPLPNPFKRVPIVELANRTTLTGEPLSAIAGVASMQNAINLLWAHLFTASDFAALPQRVVLGAQLPKVPVLDENGQKVGEKPIDLPEANIKRIINLEGPDADIKEWTAAKLDGFLEVIKTSVNHIANQTRTPAYYLVGGTTFANISADAVKALDAGLVQKVNNTNAVNAPALRDMAGLVYDAKGDTKAAAAVRAGTVLMGDVEIRSDAQLADALVKYKTIGFPFEWLAAQKIDDPDELEQVISQWKAEQGDPTLAAAMRRLEADAAATPANDADSGDIEE